MRNKKIKLNAANYSYRTITNEKIYVPFTIASWKKKEIGGESNY